jgi:hypothetical protein
MSALDVVAGAVFVFGCIALVVALVGWIPYIYQTRRGRWLDRAVIPSILTFGLCLLIFFGVCDASQDICQHRVLSDLAAFAPPITVTVDGRLSAHPQDIQTALKKLQWLPDHHSNPTKRIEVEILSADHRLDLILARDSGDPQEYWVFYPKYRITSSNEIGKIRTAALDHY